jgi:hypothetical protein
VMRLKSESEQKRGNRIGALASNLAGRRGILASAAMWSQEATDGSPAVDRIKVEYIFVDDLATVKDAQRRSHSTPATWIQDWMTNSDAKRNQRKSSQPGIHRRSVGSPDSPSHQLASLHC